MEHQNARLALLAITAPRCVLLFHALEVPLAASEDSKPKASVPGAAGLLGADRKLSS